MVDWLQRDSSREVSSNVPVALSQRCHGSFNSVTSESGISARGSATFSTSFALDIFIFRVRGALLKLFCANESSDDSRRQIPTLKEYQAWEQNSIVQMVEF